MSVDRQLLDAASTNGANEVDRSCSATIANPVDRCFGDFEFHFASVSVGAPLNTDRRQSERILVHVREL